MLGSRNPVKENRTSLEHAGTRGDWELIRLSPSGKETCILPAYPNCLAKRYPRFLAAPDRLETFPALHAEGLLVPLVDVIVQDESATFLEKRLGTNLKAFAAQGGDWFALLPALVEKLHRLEERIGFHGNLKPSNIFVVSQEIFFDDPYPGNDPSFWRKDAHFAAPECLLGAPCTASDWWSLGMVLLSLLGQDPFEGIENAAVSFLLLARPIPLPEGLPPDIRPLLRGLLIRDFRKRWGYKEVIRWIRGERIPVPEEVEEEPPFEPFELGKVRIRTPEEFAHSVTCGEELWNQGKEKLRRGHLVRWLRNVLGREDFAQDLEAILSQESDDDRALFRVAIRLAPDVPFAFCGRVLAYFSSGDCSFVPLLHLLERSLTGDEDAPSTLRIVQGVVEENLFSEYLKLKKRTELLPHIRECERRAQNGRTLQEKAILYCAYLVGRPELVEGITRKARARKAQELYAQILGTLQSRKSLQSQYYSLLELTYQLLEEGTICETFEGELAQAQEFFRRGKISQEILSGLCSLLLRAIAHATQVEPPRELAKYLPFRLPSSQENSRDIVDILEVKVERPPERTPQGSTRVLGYSQVHGRVLLFSSSPTWSNFLASLSPEDTFAALSVRKGEKSGIFYVNESSEIVLEPDLLLELGDLAQAYNNSYQRPWLFFVNRFIFREKNPRVLQGTLVAQLIALSLDSNEPPEKLFTRLLVESPTKFLSLVLNDKDPQSFQEEILKNYRRIRDFLYQNPHEALLSEESIFSPSVGLIGRVDILLKQGGFWKVVEIKTGRHPQRSLPWDEHKVQVVGYHIIAERLGIPLAQEATVFYSSAPTLEEGKKHFLIKNQDRRGLLMLRNEVVRLWRRMESNPYETLEEILRNASEEFSQDRGGYLREDFERFRRAFYAASPLSRRYYASMLGFLFREEHATRSGLLFGSFASMWRHRLEERQRLATVLPGLSWDEARTDLEKGLFTFQVDDHDHPTDFRVGDRVLIIPQEEQTFSFQGA